MKQTELYDPDYSYPFHSNGQVSTSTTDETPEEAAVRKLHEVVKEVTGKEVTQPKPRIGFLP